MPPKRTHEDPASLKEKLHAQQAPGARGRRNNNNAAPAANAAHTANAPNGSGSHLKEVMSTTDNAFTHSGPADQGGAGIAWNAQDRALLQGYRRTYRLDTPSSFKNPLSHAVLGHGIGLFSPSMARPKAKRRVPKDQLALAVRKNFNAIGVSETEVLVHMLYKVKNQDKEFRARFAPKK